MGERETGERSIWRFLPFSLDVVSVAGDSMAPTFRRGDWLLVKRFTPQFDAHTIRAGDVVLIERESQPGVIFIKRVKEIRGDSPNRHQKSYWVEGDNSLYSQDSRNWGAILGIEIVGKVLFRVRRGN